MRLPILHFALLLSFAVPSAAQQAGTTVRIENGAVYIDDRRLTAAEYPSTLRTEGQHARFRFSGDARFYIAGIPYAVRDGRIVEVEPEGIESIVVFVDPAEAGLRSEEAPSAASVRLTGSPSRTFGSFARVLDAKAAHLERLGAELSEGRESERELTVSRLHKEAEEAALVLRAFPRIEMKTYLDRLQTADAGLHSRLLQEIEMENASGRLAARIRAERDSRVRGELERSLRASLEQAFEFKQQNRRDEISQLELQLSELRAQLAAREANRARIIDRRMKDLLGPLNRRPLPNP